MQHFFYTSVLVSYQHLQFLPFKRVVIIQSYLRPWEESKVSFQVSVNNVSASNIPSSEYPSESHSSVANGPMLGYLDDSALDLVKKLCPCTLSSHCLRLINYCHRKGSHGILNPASLHMNSGTYLLNMYMFLTNHQSPTT